MPVIYIDVLFFTNFIMDSVLLTVTGRLSGKTPPVAKILIGGVLGGIYGVCVFFGSLSFLSSWLIKLVISAIMVFIVFGKCQPKMFVRLLFNYYLSAFLMGGALSAVFYFSGRHAVMANGIYYFPLSIFQLLIIALPLGLTLAFYYNKSKNRLMSHGKYCIVTICLGGNILTAEGIIDTGCSLTDPYCHRPVIIIDSTMAEKLFDCCSPAIRLIPYSTIQSAGFMKTFSPDLCTVATEKYKFNCNCSVAISPARSGGKIIINPEIFKNSGGTENDLQNFG